MFQLTTPQQNIWNLQRYYEGTSISNNCGAIFFEKKCDHKLLGHAINKLIELQSGMRLRFCEEDGHPVQYISEYQPEEFSSLFFENKEAFDAYAQQYAQTPFELIDSPMYRFLIFDLDDKTGILLCANHLISDAWAISIIASTVYECYAVLEAGEPIEARQYTYLPILEAEKKYLSSTRYEKDKSFWAEQYPNRPEVCGIKPNSAPVTHPTAKRYTTSISGKLSGEINRFYSDHGISQAVLFEAAIIAYLSRINPENQNISIGVPVLNRSGAVEKSTVSMCISTIPLTVPVQGNETAEMLCQEISARQFQLFRHHKYPYSYLLRDLHDRYGFSGNPYDIIVSFQNAQTKAKAKTQWFSNGYCEVGMEFHVDNRDGSDSYTLNIDYQTELFHQDEEIELFVARVLSIIEQIISNPSVNLNRISILPEAEMQKVLYDFNKTEIPIEREKCVHALFTERVQVTPDKIALVFEGRSFTYRQLDKMSNSLAHYLRRKGIAPGSIVPIISKRSWHMIVAMLGILKAGGAYMPVDPAYPKDRIDYMFETAECSLALTYGFSEKIQIETIPLENLSFETETNPVENLNTPEDLCYIIFTSGSTGKPKGVSICHRNVVNYSTKHKLNVFGCIIQPDESIISVTNTIFDIFVTETLLPVLNGITIYFANEEEASYQKKISRLISENHIDIIQTTPSKMRSYILDKQNLEYLKHLKAIVLGGEALPSDLYSELRNNTEAKIFNIYGPAETTVWSTIKEMCGDDITIGKPIANTQVYILDTSRNPVPIGVAGELCISGDGVGKGYLNRPELTAERFIPNPFSPGTTMYYTGDLARWRTDGEIEYLGRIDTQVKIRGLRIELGEIESIMRRFDGIVFTAVTDKKDKTGRQYLVGYYTAESEINEKELRHHLSDKLPRYMIPNYFVHLKEMPMTASGKTDRKNLPDPEFTDDIREYVEPETERERVLCDILATLLQPDRIGVTDDFFELGGDSLAAIEYVAQAHNQGIDIALQNVFDYPTVRELCEFLGSSHVRKVIYDPSDFEKYEPILSCNVVDETFIPKKESLGNVVLTGATGFLGSHIIDQFMKSEKGTIYCLVRGGSERLKITLDYYFDGIYTPEIGKRIIAIDGDITKPDLADNIPCNVQTVIHTAATVKHYGPYDYFHSVNVQGTQNVIKFAKRIGAKLLHISTISVSGNSLVDAFDVCRMEEPVDFTETTLFINQPLENVYIHSKFEAERAVLDAMLDGLDAKIIRVGNLSNRISDFRFQPNYQTNAYLNRVKAALEMGHLPNYMIPLYAEFSPIDQTAEGVVKIGQFAQAQTVFNLNSNQNLYFDRMVEILKELGIAMKIVDGDQFNQIIQDLSKNEETAYIYEAFQNDMDEDGRLVYDSNIHIRNEFTVWFLRKIGFEWAKIDFDYVKGYVEYFRKLGYLGV